MASKRTLAVIFRSPLATANRSRAFSRSLSLASQQHSQRSTLRTSCPTIQKSRGFSSTTGNQNQPVEARTSKDGVVGMPIDFDIAAKVEGNESQIVTVALEPGQVLRAESGAMMYLTDGVVMNTTTGGGLSSGFQRMLTGQNFFISDYTYEGERGTQGHVGKCFLESVSAKLGMFLIQ